MEMPKTQTGKQVLASLLRRKRFIGCNGQVNYHGRYRASVDIFRGNDYITTFEYKSIGWGHGPLITGWRKATPNEVAQWEAEYASMLEANPYF